MSDRWPGGCALKSELAGPAEDLLREVVRLALEAGAVLAQSVGEAPKRTYRRAVALAAGIRVSDLLQEVAAEGYSALRGKVSAVLDAAGPLGDVLRLALGAAGRVGGDLVRRRLLAVRYAREHVGPAPDWAVGAGGDAFEAVLRAWEDIGERLIDGYRRIANVARRLGDTVRQSPARATVKIGNAID